MTNNKDLFQKAFKYHQAGNLEAAAASYDKILEEHPGDIEVLFLLGALNLQRHNLDSAVDYLKKTLKLKPDHVIAHNNLGAALRKQGKFDEAVESYKHALKLKPDYADAYFNLGNVFKEQTKLDEASESYRQALKHNPDYATAHNNLGNVLKDQNKLDEAIESYKNAIKFKPDYTEAHYNLGNIFKDQDRFEEAIESYRQALKLKPDYATAHNNLGNTFKEQDKLEEAIESYRRAITIKPDYADAYYNLSNVLKEQGKFNEAVESGRRAIALKSDFTEAHNNLGAILQEQGLFNEAVDSYNTAIRLKPTQEVPYNNLGAALQELGKFNEAITNYDRAIKLKPDYADAHFNKSLVLLLLENFKEGWPEYEWRLRKKDCTSHNYQQPRWDGSQLNGKSILAHAEQGFGDTIQFVRYLPFVRKKGGYVIFECQHELFRLLKNCAGIDKIIEQRPDNIPSIKFNVQIPLASLPGIFGATLETMPFSEPYISVDTKLATQWREQLDRNKTYKVGIVWAGRTKREYVYRKRSCSLADFAPLADISDNIIFYSLQKGPASEEAHNPPRGMRLINLGNELNDFADTAAVIANLDLVISIDTAVAHLAGAIGKPVWTLLHLIPDWRWLLDRNDCPWYPVPPDGRAGMRLFRQTQLNNWNEVFNKVKKALILELSNERR